MLIIHSRKHSRNLVTGLGYSASISICLEIQLESSVFVSLCKCQAFSFTNVRNKDLSYGRHKKFSPVDKYEA